MNTVYKIISGIRGSDKEAMRKAQEHLDILAKPPGSLGKLEEIAAKLYAVSGGECSLGKRRVIVMSSDNGVVEEGIAATPQHVTAMQTINMLKGLTGVSVIAKHYNTDLMVVDVGVNAELDCEGLVKRKIRKSTYNIAKMAAMSKEEALQAIEIGIECVKQSKEDGFDIIGIGEMGIGNTTTSSAVLSVILGLDEEELCMIVGRGAGLTDDGYEKKIRTIKTAIKLNKPMKDDPIDVLSKVGGFDLAAMTGAFLGAAYYHMPVVIDGFISVVAALCAVKLNPFVLDYLFASHHSFERGYALAIKEIGIEASLNLDMRLGEGSGCPIMFSIMDCAISIMKNMATFEEAAIDMGYIEAIRNKNSF